MAKLKKTKMIVVVLIAMASLVALSAFFYPDFYQETEDIESEELFLPEYRTFSAKYEDMNQAHLLGEPFYLTVRIQYNADRIKIYPKSIQYSDFRPLESTGREIIKHEKVESTKTEDEEKVKNVWELSYSVELIAIEAVPGESYRIEGVAVEYMRTTDKSRKKYTMKIRPQNDIIIGSYWSGNYENAKFQPMKGKIVATIEQKQTRYLIAFGMILLSVFTILFSKAYDEKKKRTELALSLKAYSAEAFKKYHDIDWLMLDSSQDKMQSLETLTFSVATRRNKVECAEDFWTKDNARWIEMINYFNKAYSKKEIEYEDIKKAATLAEELVVTDNSKKRKKISQSVFFKTLIKKPERRGGE